VVGLAAVAGSQLLSGNGAAPGAAAAAGNAPRAGAGATTAAAGGTSESGAAPPRTATTKVSVHAGPPLAVRVPSHVTAAWTPVAQVYGNAVAWLAQQGAVTLMRFDQRYVHLTLHAGSSDGGTVGWTYGDQITPREIHHVVAGFNGGFRLNYVDVGFESGGHVAVALKPGLASIVTYTDGTTNIGAWRDGVPTVRKTVYSVLQNQRLLVDRGQAAANVSTCALACWGATIQNLVVVARSGLGITAGGQLVWAAGEQLSPASLASALVQAGAVRAVELDINPDWVDGYLYTHHPMGPVAEPVIPGQLGIAGQLLAPDSRDFFAVVAN